MGIGDFERRPEKSIDAKTASASIGCRHLVQKGFATRSHYVFHARMDWHPSVKISKQDTL